LFDTKAKVQLPFAAIRPRCYWQVTWAFVLERVDNAHTRLLVRGRAACPPDGRLHLTAMRVVHDFMETAQLRHLAARIEGRAPKSDARDVLEAVSGIAIMAAALLTPFRRGARSHWGLAAEEAARAHPGDDLVPEPSWSFTHAVEVERPADEVWPWLAQIGADKAGFYSYQALENLAGCGIRNAETVHPSWEVCEGDALRLHPDMPALPVVSVEPGRWFVAHAPLDQAARKAGRPWITMSWLFSVAPCGSGRCRVISRYRASCSDDVATRLSFGPALLEPISFAMDRRMLLGVKERAEGSARRAAEPLRRMTTRFLSL
jgi:hypothetical protein